MHGRLFPPDFALGIFLIPLLVDEWITFQYCICLVSSSDVVCFGVIRSSFSLYICCGSIVREPSLVALQFFNIRPSPRPRPSHASDSKDGAGCPKPGSVSSGRLIVTPTGTGPPSCPAFFVRFFPSQQRTSSPIVQPGPPSWYALPKLSKFSFFFFCAPRQAAVREGPQS